MIPWGLQGESAGTSWSRRLRRASRASVVADQMKYEAERCSVARAAVEHLPAGAK